jgi:hypothetical protein
MQRFPRRPAPLSSERDIARIYQTHDLVSWSSNFSYHVGQEFDVVDAFALRAFALEMIETFVVAADWT